MLKCDIGWEKHNRPPETFTDAAEGRQKDVYEALSGTQHCCCASWTYRAVGALRICVSVCFSVIFLRFVFVTSSFKQQLSMWECLTLAQSSRAVSNPSGGVADDLLSFKHTVPPPWKQIDCLSVAPSFRSFAVWFNSSWVEMLFSVLRKDNRWKRGWEFHCEKKRKKCRDTVAVFSLLNHSLKHPYKMFWFLVASANPGCRNSWNPLKFLIIWLHWSTQWSHFSIEENSNSNH